MTFGRWLLSPWVSSSADGVTERVLTFLQIVSDIALGLACLSAFAALIWLVRRRRDLISRRVVWLLGLAALTSALSQFMSATTPGAPPSLMETMARMAATVFDVAAAIAFWPIVPRLGAILSQRDEAMGALAASEAEFRASFEGSAVGKTIANPADGVILRANQAFSRMLGYTPEELAGVNAWTLSFAQDLEPDRLEFRRLLAGETDVYMREKPYRRRDGSPVWARVSATLSRDAEGAPRQVHAVIEDIDDRRRAEAAAREYETRLRFAAEAAQIAVWEIDYRRNIGRLDLRASEMTWGQVPPEVWLPLDGPEFSGWVARIHPEDRPARDAAVQAVRDGARDVVQMEYRARRPDGAWGWQSHWRLITERELDTGKPIRVLGVIMDTTQRALAEAELRATLAQRDLLLREVYHRVKNNLQIVDGIVMMQVRALKDDQAREALKALRSRIYALGLVHHQLMTSKDLETFELEPFLDELTRNILDGGGAQSVSLDLQVEPMRAGLDFAIPLGLLVTELVTNTLKHAFKDGVGRIRVTLKRRADGRYDLIVADNGVGRPEGGVARGLGSVIIAGLVAQLDGEIATHNDNGLVTEITLSPPERT